MSVAGIYS